MTSPPPRARLRSRGLYWYGDDLIVATPGLVAEALTHPALSVVPARSASVMTVPLRARMARFSDGAKHAARRDVVLRLLPEPTALAADAQREATAVLDGKGSGCDVMPVARTVPVRVLARALGAAAADLDRVVDATGRLCDALAPALPSWVGRPDAAPAARLLEETFAGTGSDGVERIAAAIGILFQARDATAALIGSTVLAAGRGVGAQSADAAMDEVLRHDAPVQSTKRIAVEDLTLGGVHVPRNSTVWVMLGAVDCGPPADPATFGAGPHACPGSVQARALAGGVLAALRAGGWTAVEGQRVRYEPRPNLRVPASVLVQRL